MAMQIRTAFGLRPHNPVAPAKARAHVSLRKRPRSLALKPTSPLHCIALIVRLVRPHQRRRAGDGRIYAGSRPSRSGSTLSSRSLLAALLLLPGAAEAADPPPFKFLRPDEDYSYLRGQRPRDIGERIKFIALNRERSAYLSLGGEFRPFFEAIDAPRFGVGGGRSDAYLLQRTLLHADLHFGDHVRLFGTLGIHQAFGKDRPTGPSDRNGADVQQLFVDLMPDAEGRWRARLGRQELLFSPTQRFISVREGPNIRRSFDGAVVTRRTSGLRVDAFYLNPVAIELGAFNDSRDRSQDFYGVYASRLLGDDSLDLYWLRLDRDRVRFGGVLGDERRTSFGVRFAGKSGRLDYDLEAMVQRGRFAGRNIRAWGFGLDAGYTLDLGWSPRLGIRLDGGTGDSDPNDGKLETFNPLFPRGAHFNSTSLTSYANLLAVRPTLRIRPAKGVQIDLTGMARWRRTGRDAIYLQPMVPLAPPNGDRSRHVGNALQLETRWQVDRNIRMSGELVYQAADDAVRALGGSDARYAAFAVQFRF